MSEANHTTQSEWREIPWIPRHRVNTEGKVQFRRIRGDGRWEDKKLHNKYSSTPDKAPYLSFAYSENGETKNCSVSRLVLEVFVGPCPPGMEACHNNGDSLDNRLENLRWDTRKNNHADKATHGTLLKGSQIHGASLTEEIVEKIVGMLMEGRSGREIRDVHDISPKMLNKIARKTHWKHVVPGRPVMNVPKPRGYKFQRDLNGFKVGGLSRWTKPKRDHTPATSV